jgi:hypothetical protein
MRHQVPRMIKEAAGMGVLKYLAKPLIKGSLKPAGLFFKYQYGKKLLDSPKVFKKMPELLGKFPAIKKTL